MPGPNDSPNTGKINTQVDQLKRLRAAGSAVVGWGDGEMPPTTANALLKAGLLVAPAGTKCGAVVRPA